MKTFVSLSDQIPLTRNEIARALRARDTVAGFVREREQYIYDEGLDPTVWLPRANWELGRPFYDRALPLLRGDVGHLRLLAGHFTGYDLSTMGGAVPAGPLDQIAAPLADYLATHQPGDAEILYRRYAEGLPDWLHISPPAKFGEIGWLIDGAIVNHDTAAYAERIATMYRAGLLDELRAKPSCSVLEIGGGYGALGYYLKTAIPQIRYTIVDLPESLIYSAIYLSALFPENVEFVPNHAFPALSHAGASFDLVINTLSMSEMTEQQVRSYCAGIKRIIGVERRFFEQNQDNRHIGFLNARDIIASFFPHCRPLGGPNRDPFLTQGAAHIWSA